MIKRNFKCRGQYYSDEILIKNARVRLQGEFVFSTADLLKFAREAEEKPVAKQPHGRPRKRPM